MRALPLAALGLALAARLASAAEELSLPALDPVAVSFQSQVTALLPLADRPAGMAQALSAQLASPLATDADRAAASLLIQAAADPRTALASAAAQAPGARSPALVAAVGQLASLPAARRGPKNP